MAEESGPAKAAAVKKKNKRKEKNKQGSKKKQQSATREDVVASAFDSGDLATAELEAIVFGRSAVTAAAEETKKTVEDISLRPRAQKRKTDAPIVAADPEAWAGSKPSTSAWTDPDDQTLSVSLDPRRGHNKLKKFDNEKRVTGHEYERRLREHFVKMHGHVSWTQERPAEEHSDSEDEDEEREEEPQQRPAATSARPIADQTGGMLRPGVLAIKRLKNVPVAPGEGKGPSAIQAMQFHPTSELLLCAGLDKRLHLFSVDGDENTKLSSHFFKKFPITEACFAPSGDQVLMTTGFGSRLWGLDVSTGEPLIIRPQTAQQHTRYFGLAAGPHTGDAPGMRSSQMFSIIGDNGTTLVCDAATKHPIRTLRMRAPGVAAVFSTSRDSLFTADQECNLYEWDLGSGRCLQRMKDPWATKITCLDMSRSSSYSPTPILAVGTASGNVDFFDAGGPKLSKEPTSTIDNLTTRVTHLRFHPEGEMVAASSRLKKDSLKLAHTRTTTVFENWPTRVTPLQRVSVVDFSRRDGLMAVGNEQGRILVYQLAHFAGGAR